MKSLCSFATLPNHRKNIINPEKKEAPNSTASNFDNNNTTYKGIVLAGHKKEHHKQRLLGHNCTHYQVPQFARPPPKKNDNA